MDPKAIGELLVAFILLFYLCMSVVFVTENRVYIVENFGGRYVRGISGIKNMCFATQADVDNGNAKKVGWLIPGKDSGTIEFVPWIFYHLAKYELRRNLDIPSAELSKEDEDNISWGKLGEDKMVTLVDFSISNHYRYQYTYLMIFDSLETGKKHADQGAAQNIKMRVKLRVTVRTCCPVDTMYQESDGGRWIFVLHDVIMSGLNELFAARSFDDISNLRAVKLDDVELKGKRTFLQRVNDQMLDVKELGQETIDMDFVDYEVSKESQSFLDALKNKAASVINKQTAANNADAERLLLQPKIDAAKAIMNQERDNQIAIKETPDATSKNKYESLKGSQIRVFVDGGSDKMPEGGRIDKLINGITDLTVVKEIADEANDDNSKNNTGKNSKKK